MPSIRDCAAPSRADGEATRGKNALRQDGAREAHILSFFSEAVHIFGGEAEFSNQMRSKHSERGTAALVAAALLPLGAAVLLGSCQATKAPSLPTAGPATIGAPTAAPPTHEWVLVDLPASATQLQYGAEVYRLVCSACHGDHGQGLTDAWRATWAPSDQNCWQSK